MADIDSIVSVTITADSKTPSRRGFGIPALMSYHTVFPETYRRYTAAADMLSDGFTLYDNAYRMAAAAFNADPTVEQVIVGRLPAAPSYSTELTITSAVQGAYIRFNIIEPTTGTVQPIEYLIGAAETTTTVATAVELLVEAVTGVSSSSAGAVITITPTVAGRKVFVYDLENCKVQDITADAGYDTALAALQVETDDWYGVAIDVESQANVNDVAAWCLTNNKLYFQSTQSSYELDGTGTLGSTLKAASNDRTVILWAPNAHEYAAVTWMAVGLAQDPGVINWAYQELPGITAAISSKQATLTATQKTNLETDNINHYLTVAGLNVTRYGYVTSGEWIDVRHGIDALTARLQEAVFGLLASGRVPYTNLGLDMVANVVLGVLKAFEGTVEQPGLIARGTSAVIMPALSSITSADKAARRLRGIRFSGTLTGSINKVEIRGTISN